MYTWLLLVLSLYDPELIFTVNTMVNRYTFYNVFLQKSCPRSSKRDIIYRGFTINIATGYVYLSAQRGVLLTRILWK